MNLLAHAVLSPPNSRILLGNMATDFLSNSQIAQLPDEVRVGSQLHREIDRYTDQHPLVEEAKQKLVGFQRFANPLMDIFYDHFLAVRYADQGTFRALVDSVYRELSLHLYELPDGAHGILRNVVETDWIGKYRTVEGLETTLDRLERRVRFRSGRDYELKQSLVILVDHYSFFQNNFDQFWAELETHIQKFRTEILGVD
jgi:acyl carrier protein phosphodiesterase